MEWDEIDEDTYMYKIRAELVKGYNLRIRVLRDRDFIRYSYQLYTDRPIVRWDNTEHYPDISAHPHHFHDKEGKIILSSLSGIPKNDLVKVLSEVKNYLAFE